MGPEGGAPKTFGLQEVSADDIAGLRDEALRKIGRNLALYQKLEAMMKFIAAHADVQAEVTGLRADGLTAVMKKQRRSVRKATFGTLKKHWMERLFATKAGDQEQLEAHATQAEAAEPRFRFEFSMETTAGQREEREAVMARLLRDRNALVHRRLVEFNHESSESCQRLIAELDDAYAVLRPEVMYAQAIIKGFQDLTADMKRWIDSEEGLQAFIQSAPPPDAKH